MGYLEQSDSETESRMLSAEGCGEGQMGRCLMGTESQFSEMESSGDRVAQQGECT